MFNNIKKSAKLFAIAAFIGTSTLSVITPAEAAVIDTNLVWRVQVAIRVGDIENAGTNGLIKAKLNDKNVSFLNKSGQDFARGSFAKYDLSINDVENTSNIKYLELVNTSLDSLCINSVDLYVNNLFIKTISFGKANACKSLQSPLLNPFYSSYKVFSYDDIRTALSLKYQHSQALNVTKELGISSLDFTSRLEDAIGNQLAQTSNWKWGPQIGTTMIEYSVKNNYGITLDINADIHKVLSPLDGAYGLGMKFKCISKNTLNDTLIGYITFIGSDDVWVYPHELDNITFMWPSCYKMTVLRNGNISFTPPSLNGVLARP